MRKFTILLLLIMVSVSYAQNAPINFEPGGEGADWNWKTFENGDNPVLEIVSIAGEGLNPGGNTTATAAKFIARADGELFAGVESAHPASDPPYNAPSEIGTFVFDDTNNAVFIWVYQVGFASRFALKFAAPDNGALIETIVNNPSPDQWNLLLFDMSALNGMTRDQIIFFPDYQERSVDQVIYFDEVTFGVLPPPTCDDNIQNGNETGVDCGGPDCDECPPLPKPLVSAPIPMAPASDVINKYSDTYNPGLVNGVDVNNWFGCVVVEGFNETIDGVNPVDNIKGYDRSTVACINWDGPPGVVVDASDMNYFYVDVWTSDVDPNRQTTNLAVKLENQGPGLFINKSFSILPNVWNTLEIDLNDTDLGPMSDPNNRTACFQMVLEGNGGTDFFIDNVYFSSTRSLGIDEFESNGGLFSYYPNPVSNTLTLNAQKDIEDVVVYNMLGQQVMRSAPNAVNSEIDMSALKTGAYFVRVTINERTETIRVIKN